MDESLNKIISYAKKHPEFSAPELQNDLHIGYRELTAALKDLQKKGTIKIIGGMRYKYNIRPTEDAHKAEIQSEDEEKAAAERLAYFEARRQELIRRLQAELEEDDEDDDDEYDECDDDDEDESGEDDAVTISGKESDSETLDPIALQALRYCIQRQSASTALIQRKFSIGYVRATKIIDWMESMGYITSSNGSISKKVLLTEERFMELYGEDSEDKKETNNAAKLHNGVGNLCEVLKKEAEEKRGATILSDEFLDKIKSIACGELFEVYKSLCYLHICAKGLTFSNGEKAAFFIHHYGKITELCDGGLTAKRLQRKPGYGYKRTKNTLEKLTDGLMIRMDDKGQLLVDVSDLSKIPAMYYYFYWAIESLIA